MIRSGLRVALHGGDDEELARLNALMRDITQHTNHGASYDLMELAERHGVSPENAWVVEASLSRLEQAMQMDIPGGFPGIPVPSPEERMMLSRPFPDAGLFALSTGEQVRRLHREVAAGIAELASQVGGSGRVEEPSLQTLPDVLDGADDRFWHDRHHSVLRYTILLLCRKSGGLEKADDYGAEVLRLYWQVLIRDRTSEHIRGFLEMYEDWSYRVLVRAGLIDAEERDGELWIGATPFFRAWISLSGYWRE